MAISEQINRRTSQIINAMNINTVLKKILSFVIPNRFTTRTNAMVAFVTRSQYHTL
jgi:hypothetical protein